MPEKANNKTIFSLLEVALSIQKTLSTRYARSFWVKAEMNKLNLYPQSGHCYPELIEKKEGTLIAQVKAILWKDDYITINNNFLKILKEPLKNGINILLYAKIIFDPVHGLSLRILDIDPSYSLGELEREKQETIAKLKEEGLFEINKRAYLPLLPQRIAVISADTSKGYSDFLEVIEANTWGYRFFHMLFPTVLQGERAVESIIGQLHTILKVIHHFDVVAIIRGGGGDVGLTCYNNWQLSKEIALFPIPVLTGIGHSTNETVVEMIAYKNAITPTGLGDWLIQKFHDFSVPVIKAEETIIDKSMNRIRDEKLKFFNSVKFFRSVTGNLLLRSNHEIRNIIRLLNQQSVHLLQKEKQEHTIILNGLRRETLTICMNTRLRIKEIVAGMKKDAFLFIRNKDKELTGLEKNISIMNPENVLKRGYSITLLNGRAVKTIAQVVEGDVLKTVITDGNIISTAKTIHKSTKNE
jgi:exodeoxyribonuclease VII large subunit